MTDVTFVRPCPICGSDMAVFEKRITEYQSDSVDVDIYAFVRCSGNKSPGFCPLDLDGAELCVSGTVERSAQLWNDCIVSRK